MLDRSQRDDIRRLAVLDVRGTLLDGHRDIEIGWELLIEMAGCLHDGITLGLLTGCSRHTVERLVLAPWKMAAQSEQRLTVGGKAALYVYTENGCHGHVLDSQMFLSKLRDYPCRMLDDSTRARICWLLSSINAELGLGAEIQPRSGQVNFYFQACYDERLALAGKIAALFRDAELPELSVFTPTSKNVVDISLRSKTDALADLLPRAGISNTANVLAVSDSFQVGGADHPMIGALTSARFVHVGPMDMSVPTNVFKAGGGPHGTEQAIASWRKAFLPLNCHHQV